MSAGGVVCCGHCGEPVTVRCQCGHEPEPYRVRDAVDRTARDNRPRAKPTFKQRTCACGRIFTPTGGRDVRCPACKGKV